MQELIVYAGTYFNKGGAAIAYGTLQTLEKLQAKTQHIVDPEPFPGEFFQEFHLKPLFRYSDIMCKQTLPGINPLLFFKPFIYCFFKSYQAQIKKLAGQPIWHIGDSPFSDKRSALSIVGQVFALQTLKNVIRGKVIIGGVSLGYPRTWLGRVALGWFLRNSTDYIYVRGKETKEVCLRLGMSEDKISMICDFAYQLNPKGTPATKKLAIKINASGKRKVAMIFREHSKGEIRDRYMSNIKKLSARLAELNYQTFFISTSYSYFVPENDLIFMKDQLHLDDQQIINIEELTPGEIIAVFSNFDALISARLHGAILGTLAHTPTIHLYDSSKSLEVIGDIFGEQVPLLELDDFAEKDTVEEIASMIDKAAQDKPRISVALKECIDQARTQAIDELTRTFKTLGLVGGAKPRE